jgi:hypothetical protein
MFYDGMERELDHLVTIDYLERIFCRANSESVDIINSFLFNIWCFLFS